MTDTKANPARYAAGGAQEVSEQLERSEYAPNAPQKQATSSTSRLVEAAQHYRDVHGCVPLRLKDKSPQCMGSGWTERTLKHPVPEFEDGDNIGILLGEPSGDLVRLDPDFTPLSGVMNLLWPEPTWTYGRESSPRSGRLYRCKIKSKDFDLPSSVKDDPRLPLGNEGKPSVKVYQILSTGKQTMVPPSVHLKTGETLVWQKEKEIAPVALESPELTRRAGLEAFLMAVTHFWPPRGTRNYAAMALTRVLLEVLAEKYPNDDKLITLVDKLVLEVSMDGGDGEESRKGKERARKTLEKMRAGEDTTGLPRLVELLGLPADVAGTFRKWLGVTYFDRLTKQYAVIHPGDSVSARRAERIAENIKIGDDIPAESILPSIMTLDEMLERLVFVSEVGGVADRITGRIHKKEHAADAYAASKHTYVHTQENGAQKKRTGSALKFWIESKDRLTVQVLAWVPGAPQICHSPEERKVAFNTWKGLPAMAFPEDWQERVKPFLEHVEFLVPIKAERERFLQWLAHIIQCPEVLPHTSYLMTTPTTGVGRNLLASTIVRALRGFVAAGISLPELLDGGFTGRLSKKLLAIVDEAREGSGDRRHQRAERLKSITTEEHRHVNPKYGHQSVEKNCCRWLMFSNHQDAIPFDNSDRRVIVIANPTVRNSEAYYERLYGLLDDHSFIGSVRRWLETADISGFRPGEHAPMNAAKTQALNEMMTETERAVLEFKEDCENPLTSRSKIRCHATENNQLHVNDTHLTHAIRRAGMTNTARRVWTKRKDDKNKILPTGFQQRLSVVIVKGEWTVETVKKAADEELLKAMGELS
jgi:Family of unknown function (DUF5906)